MKPCVPRWPRPPGSGDDGHCMADASKDPVPRLRDDARTKRCRHEWTAVRSIGEGGELGERQLTNWTCAAVSVEDHHFTNAAINRDKAATILTAKFRLFPIAFIFLVLPPMIVRQLSTRKGWA